MNNLHVLLNTLKKYQKRDARGRKKNVVLFQRFLMTEGHNIMIQAMLKDSLRHKKYKTKNESLPL